MAQLYGLVFVQDYPLKVGGLLLLICNQSVPYPMYSGHHSLKTCCSVCSRALCGLWTFTSGFCWPLMKTLLTGRRFTLLRCVYICVELDFCFKLCTCIS